MIKRVVLSLAFMGCLLGTFTGNAKAAPVHVPDLEIQSQTVDNVILVDDSKKYKKSSNSNKNKYHSNNNKNKKYHGNNKKYKTKTVNKYHGNNNKYYHKNNRYKRSKTVYYNRNKYGPRYKYKRPGYGYYYGGYYYAQPWWTVGLPPGFVVVIR
ncbi:hypothetical protein FHS85_000700 [Rhodoligotrophos appendicifer]|uniref:hypothetical protein n=1 Tax=Rhodoligotrophos appendicifer TaxID=987056 RepID=UPI0011807ABE|nr:hypothetical protein [Rhodoligotrophos appendicifer]